MFILHFNLTSCCIGHCSVVPVLCEHGRRVGEVQPQDPPQLGQLILRPSPGELLERGDEHGDHLLQNPGPKSTMYDGSMSGLRT